MRKIESIFNNREIAVLIWLGIFLIFILFHKKTRSPLLQILKALAAWKMLLIVILMIAYILLIIWGFEKVGLWYDSMIKNTIIWTFGSAFIILINSDKANKDDLYFKKIILDCIKWTVVLEFIINLYVFDLIIELILIPIIFVFAIMVAYMDSKSEFSQVKKILDYFLGIVGIGLLCFAVFQITQNFKGFATKKNALDFLLPIWLTFTFIPFAYMTVLLMTYESLFTSINFRISQDNRLKRFVKLKILQLCHLNLVRLNRFNKKFGQMNLATKNDIIDSIRKFKMNENKVSS